MSRIYALQAPRLAAAAARMKADVNFLGAVGPETALWLEDNHVFPRDVWSDGSVTEKRLQRLYHRLFPGDWLFMDGTLPGHLASKASDYARDSGARVVIGLRAGTTAAAIGDAADILVHEPGAAWTGNPGAIVKVGPGDNLEAWVGTLAICLMNGLDLERAEPLCRRAAAFSDLPWYDEIAYAQSAKEDSPTS